jgi:flagellar basal-body rod protein FlgG
MPSFTQILETSRSGMLSRLLHLDVTSNNLANISTNGYKRGRANFQEVLGAAQYNGSTLQATQHILDQGSLKQTSNPLDLAIQGEGFFGALLPDGRTAYTRDGQLYLDANGELVTAGGFRLVWDGEVPAGAQDVHVNPDGSVMALVGGAWTEAGTIPLHRFPNPSALLGYGQNLWLATPVSGEAAAGTPGTAPYGVIVGRALEASNVNMAEEMATMVTLQRSFEMSLRVFQQTEGMLGQAIHMRRG